MSDGERSNRSRGWLWGAAGVITIALAVGLALWFRPPQEGRITAGRALEVVEERLLHGKGEAVGDGKHVLTAAERRAVVEWLHARWPSREPYQSYDPPRSEDTSLMPIPDICINYYPTQTERDADQETIQILVIARSWVTVSISEVNAKKDWCRVAIEGMPKTGEWFAGR